MKIVYVERGNPMVPQELISIMECWYDQTLKNGDRGTCVMDAGLKFRYKGRAYFMPPYPAIQGSLSWEIGMDRIVSKLRDIGAENVIYVEGHMD